MSAPWSTRTNAAVRPRLAASSSSVTARAVRLVAWAHHAASGSARGSSTGTRNRAGELRPPHHMWNPATAATYGTVSSQQLRGQPAIAPPQRAEPGQRHQVDRRVWKQAELLIEQQTRRPVRDARPAHVGRVPVRRAWIPRAVDGLEHRRATRQRSPAPEQRSAASPRRRARTRAPTGAATAAARQRPAPAGRQWPHSACAATAARPEARRTPAPAARSAARVASARARPPRQPRRPPVHRDRS